ncbi:MAG: hypothetical protein KDH96_02685 [Candidatus Riesia sp.]|nr:hypothetical protein [Candidatus Riesia sp.]
MKQDDTVIVYVAYLKFWKCVPDGIKKQVNLLEKDVAICYKFFSENKTMDQIGKEEKCTRQRISIRKNRAIQRVMKAFELWGFSWDLNKRILIGPAGTIYQFV